MGLRNFIREWFDKRPAGGPVAPHPDVARRICLYCGAEYCRHVGQRAGQALPRDGGPADGSN